MAGYCIELYKFMRVDKNFSKKERLLNFRQQPNNSNTNNTKNESNNDNHIKYHSYGEFDRISFKEVKSFPRLRDIPPEAKNWIGDRQTLLVYDIITGDDYPDGVQYHDNRFYESNSSGLHISQKLFIGISIMQFKNIVEKKDINKLLRTCKEEIIKLVSESHKDLKCSVLGTLGSFGIVILWLADQYVDILQMVTTIKNTDVSNKYKKEPIFLSAYTIFAQNHISNKFEKFNNVEGQAIIHLTLKQGIVNEIEKQLRCFCENTYWHCSGEYDIAWPMATSKVLPLLEKGANTPLYFDSRFFRKYILQLNVHLYEQKSLSVQSNLPEIEEKNASDNEPYLTQLDEIQTVYQKLRESLIDIFPSTAGMVDTLDLLYCDYISKISTASNEMWVEIFTHQFHQILSCILNFADNLKDAQNNEITNMQINKHIALQTINDLLSNFERQISHIAESNNLYLGTPMCQLRYSGQNNLTLYAYFGVIKSALSCIYKMQGVNEQAEIIPLIVADLVPLIQSNLYIKHNNNTDPRVLAITIPMASLYNPIHYYPYLYHELFHYVVPLDRHYRNELYGCLISIEILRSLYIQAILHNKMRPSSTFDISIIGEDKAQELLTSFVDEYVLRYICMFIIKSYSMDIGKELEFLGNQDISQSIADKKSLEANSYIQQLMNKWKGWLDCDKIINASPIYLFLCFLKNIEGKLNNDLSRWCESQPNENFENIKLFEKNIKGIHTSWKTFIDTKINPDSADTAYNQFLSILDESILDSSDFLISAVKEAVVDISMVAMGEMNFAEYLLLFIITQKNLLHKFDTKTIPSQDIIRIGMVFNYLTSNKENGARDIRLYTYKEDFINMYLGLYFKTNKSDYKAHWNTLSKEAENWFSFLQRCISKYFKAYALYIPFFEEIQNGLLIAHIDNNNLDKDSEYWKQYAETLRCKGYSIKNIIHNDSPDSIIESINEACDDDIFNINIRFIHHFQEQESFDTLKELRKTTSEKQKNKPYKYNLGTIKNIKMPNVESVPKSIHPKQFHLTYKVNSVGSLATQTAEIAQRLRKSAQKVLGENEYPIWYRGQQSAKYKLIPSIMRKYKGAVERLQGSKNDKPKLSLMQLLRQEYDEFKFRADGTIEAFDRTGYTEADYIALMQHYSVPSNFLDWTEDALSALYFALEGFLDNKVEKTATAAALYIFSPGLYNRARLQLLQAEKTHETLANQGPVEKDVINNKQEGIPNLTVEYNAKHYQMYLLGDVKTYGTNAKYDLEEMRKQKKVFYLPIAIYVSRLNRRIQAQSGIFMAYNIYTSPDGKNEFDYISLEEIQNDYLEKFKEDEKICPFLYKIEIQEDKREEIASWVKAFGMSKEKCYPELQNIGERIMR